MGNLQQVEDGEEEEEEEEEDHRRRSRGMGRSSISDVMCLRCVERRDVENESVGL